MFQFPHNAAVNSLFAHAKRHNGFLGGLSLQDATAVITAQTMFLTRCNLQSLKAKPVLHQPSRILPCRASHCMHLHILLGKHQASSAVQVPCYRAVPSFASFITVLQASADKACACGRYWCGICQGFLQGLITAACCKTLMLLWGDLRRFPPLAELPSAQWLGLDQQMEASCF